MLEPEIQPVQDAMLQLSRYLSLFNRALLSGALLLIPSVTLSVSAEETVASTMTIKSSVAKEFRNGLHEKYLKYLAEKLDMELDITPMPFPRRLKSLRNGTIDIMVGVKHTHIEHDDFAFLKPSYESLRNAYFVRSTDKDKLKSREDMEKLTIGITSDEKEQLNIISEDGLSYVTLITLKQKIEMLMKGRIDMFTHFEFSALDQIQEMGLEKEIVLSDYQTTKYRDYHFAVSTHSPLMAMKEDIEAIIKQGVESGDFRAIRKAHYQESK